MTQENQIKAERIEELQQSVEALRVAEDPGVADAFPEPERPAFLVEDHLAVVLTGIGQPGELELAEIALAHGRSAAALGRAQSR